MKTEDLILLGALGFGAMMLMKRQASAMPVSTTVNPYNAAPDAVDPNTLLRKQMQLQLAQQTLGFITNKLTGLFGGSSGDPVSQVATDYTYNATPDSSGTWYV